MQSKDTLSDSHGVTPVSENELFEWAMVEIDESTYRLTISVRVSQHVWEGESNEGYGKKYKRKMLLQELVDVIDTLLEVWLLKYFIIIINFF